MRASGCEQLFGSIRVEPSPDHEYECILSPQGGPANLACYIRDVILEGCVAVLTARFLVRSDEPSYSSLSREEIVFRATASGVHFDAFSSGVGAAVVGARPQ